MNGEPQIDVELVRDGEVSITRAQARALTSRADLLAAECDLVWEQRITWRGRLAALGDYGRTGGSAADRRAIVEAMAALEARS